MADVQASILEPETNSKGYAGSRLSSQSKNAFLEDLSRLRGDRARDSGDSVSPFARGVGALATYPGHCN
jgi:hypothetical protein